MVVRIDGRDFELRAPLLMSDAALRRVGAYSERARQLEAGEMNEAGITELAQCLERICRAVLAAPDEVQAALTDEMRFKVWAAWASTLPVTVQ